MKFLIFSETTYIPVRSYISLYFLAVPSVNHLVPQVKYMGITHQVLNIHLRPPIFTEFLRVLVLLMCCERKHKDWLVSTVRSKTRKIVL